jgi:hypothetical protein
MKIVLIAMNIFVFSTQHKLLLTLNLIIMKKVNFFRNLICTFIFAIFLSSFSENSNHEFSHDSKIESWVQENKKETVNFNRNKIKSFSIEKQRAILRALPAKSKKKIWQEKVNYILNFELSKEEKKFLELFGLAFKKMNYETPTPQKVSDELNEKVMTGAKKFNWSSEFVYSMFFSVGDVHTEKIKSNLNTSEKMRGEPTDCNCYYNGGCSGWNNNCNEPDTCQTANNNCGVFGGTQCDGYCTSDISYQQGFK